MYVLFHILFIFLKFPFNASHLCPGCVWVFFTSLDMFIIFVIAAFVSSLAISNPSCHVGVCFYWLIFLLIVIIFS